jgi:glycosyltransferase involved in cell wall biosynthesis
MKVVLIGPYSPQGNRISGGPEAVVVQLAEGLRRQGDVEVHVLTQSSQVAEDSTQLRDGVSLHVLRLRRLPRWTMIRINARVLADAIKRIGPDVVHAHTSSTYGEAALRGGAPAVITVHGVIRQEAQVFRRFGISWRQDLSWRYEEWYETWCLRRAQDVIAISPYVEQIYRPMTAARLHLVENPVADAYFNLPASAEPPTILAAARIIRRKNILSLLQAFAQVHREFPGVRLRLAGETHYEPDYAAQCRQFVSEHGLDGAVDFLGWLDEPSMLAEYSQCAVLVLLSWQETAPVAIAQAMAAGKGIVASDVGGVRYLLADGRAGLLVAPDDVPGQAAALRRLLANEAVCCELGAAARREAEARFRVDVVAARARAVYEQVIHLQRRH